MIKKFKAIDLTNKKVVEFDLGNIYGYEGEVCGVILPDEQTVLNYNSGYGYEGFNQDLKIVQCVGLKDIDGNEFYEYDKVLVEEHAFHKKEDDLTGIDIDGEYYVKWSENMDLILVRHPNDEGGWLLNKMLYCSKIIGNAYLEDLNW